MNFHNSLFSFSPGSQHEEAFPVVPIVHQLLSQSRREQRRGSNSLRIHRDHRVLSSVENLLSWCLVPLHSQRFPRRPQPGEKRDPSKITQQWGQKTTGDPRTVLKLFPINSSHNEQLSKPLPFLCITLKTKPKKKNPKHI